MPEGFYDYARPLIARLREQTLEKLIETAQLPRSSQLISDLRDALDWNDDWDFSDSLEGMRGTESRAQYFLIEEDRRKSLLENGEPAFMKKRRDLHNSLEKCVTLLRDPDTRNFLPDEKDDPEHYIGFETLLRPFEELLAPMEQLRELFEIACQEPTGKAGRPSLKALANYVFQIILIYEQFSKQKFSFYRFEESSFADAKKYRPITPGHQFVAVSVEYLNSYVAVFCCSAIYSDGNIVTAIENARKRLNSIPR